MQLCASKCGTFHAENIFIRFFSQHPRSVEIPARCWRPCCPPGAWCGEKLIHEIEIEIAQPRIFHHQLVAKQFYCQEKYLHEVVFTLSSHKMNGILKKPIANHSKHDNNAAPNPSRHLHTCHTSLLSSSQNDASKQNISGTETEYSDCVRLS